MAILIPAVLTGDKNDLNVKINQLVELGFKRIQIDIIDGQFAANYTIGPSDIPEPPENIELELHLMVKKPTDFIPQIKHPNVRTIIFHLETSQNPVLILPLIPPGIEKGIAINPDTPIENLNPYLDKIDLALILSVEPGKQGQHFIGSSIKKIQELHKSRPLLNIEVDGGITISIASQVVNAGASRVVVGSGILQASDPEQIITTYKKQIGEQP